MEDKRGILIAIEGIDGTGKSTQAHLLSEALESVGEEVTLSKEPTDGKWGQKIRNSAQNGRLPLDEELEAFTKDRKEHVEKLITPKLRKGNIVVLDRYFYSTIAYQGSRGANIDEVDRKMREIAPVPDMVFLLDIHPQKGISRISEEREEIPDHFEGRDDLTAVRKVFNKLSETDDRIWKIDGSLSINEIHTTILKLLVDNVLKEKRCAKPHGCHDFHHCGPRLNGNCRWYEIASSLGVDIEGEKYAGLLSTPKTENR